MFILLLSLALSMDALAVSIGIGISSPKLSLKQSLLPPLSFGLFQAVMPFAGYTASIYAQGEFDFDAYDHWIAFALLAIIGTKMIFDTISEMHARPNQKKCDKYPSLKTILALSIATSIDAFAAGISLACLDRNIYEDIFVIGIITFLFSIIGIKFGSKIGEKMGEKFGILGGIILIVIGIKIVIAS